MLFTSDVIFSFFFFFFCSSDWSLEALLHRWDLDCVEVPLDEFGADRPDLAGSALPGSHSVQMMIITRRTEDAGASAVQAVQD